MKSCLTLCRPILGKSWQQKSHGTELHFIISFILSNKQFNHAIENKVIDMTAKNNNNNKM